MSYDSAHQMLFELTLVALISLAVTRDARSAQSTRCYLFLLGAFLYAGFRYGFRSLVPSFEATDVVDYISMLTQPRYVFAAIPIVPLAGCALGLMMIFLCVMQIHSRTTASAKTMGFLSVCIVMLALIAGLLRPTFGQYLHGLELNSVITLGAQTGGRWRATFMDCNDDVVAHDIHVERCWVRRYGEPRFAFRVYRTDHQLPDGWPQERQCVAPGWCEPRFDDWVSLDIFIDKPRSLVIAPAGETFVGYSGNRELRPKRLTRLDLPIRPTVWWFVVALMTAVLCAVRTHIEWKFLSQERLLVFELLWIAQLLV